MKEKSQNVKLGLFVVIASILFITAIYLIGNSDGLFKSTFTIHCAFDDVKGLQVGNNVRYSGINIGSVKKIKMQSASQINVEMSIEQTVKQYMRKNATAVIETSGLVGNMVVNIMPIAGDAPLVNNNDFIISGSTSSINEIFSSVDSTLIDINIIAHNLAEITNQLNKNNSILGLLINDDIMGESFKNTINDIKTASHNLNETSFALTKSMEDIQKGEGIVGYLLKDTTFQYQVNNLISSVDNTINKSTKKAIADLSTASLDIANATTKINQILDQTVNGNNTVQTLLYDSIMTNQLKSTISNLNEGSEKLNESLEGIKGTWLFRKFINQKSNE